jgi:DNA processing protein
MRNRIISGLCHELLIMQAEERSGSMSTARHALDQGCQIYVLRHPSQDARACGSKKLIEEGAVAIDGAEDFFLKVLLDKHSSVN